MPILTPILRQLEYLSTMITSTSCNNHSKEEANPLSKSKHWCPHLFRTKEQKGPPYYD